MSRSLAAIKVVIRLRPDGRAQYPDFNSLQTVIDSGSDWSQYVDRDGEGWHYDSLSGHVDDDVDSPRGTQFGMLLIPQSFATEALAAFPADITVLTETQCQDFYDNRAHSHEREEIEDENVLRVIDLRERLTRGNTPRRPEDVKALDPKDPAPGLQKNPNRFWTDYKAKRGIVFQEPV